ncbi:hypothetical protein M5689_010749 [Euphorbia peplus]|nr:hypothetical protein M5689_010749 [Euphorbia peplus]
MSPRLGKHSDGTRPAGNNSGLNHRAWSLEKWLPDRHFPLNGWIRRKYIDGKSCHRNYRLLIPSSGLGGALNLMVSHFCDKKGISSEEPLQRFQKRGVIISHRFPIRHPAPQTLKSLSHISREEGGGGGGF